jgi:hypothetical protein
LQAGSHGLLKLRAERGCGGCGFLAFPIKP